MTKTGTFDSVWDALADTPQQAANLRNPAGFPLVFWPSGLKRRGKRP